MWKIQTYSEHVKISACTCNFICLLLLITVVIFTSVRLWIQHFFVLMSYTKCRWRWHIHVSFLLWFWACCMSSTCDNDCVLTSDSYIKYHKYILFIESAFGCNYRPLKLSFFLPRSSRVRPLFSLLPLCAGLFTILTLLARERTTNKWIFKNTVFFDR